MNNLMTQSWTIERPAFQRLGTGQPGDDPEKGTDDESHDDDVKGPGMDLTEFDNKVAAIRRDLDDTENVVHSLGEHHAELKAAVRAATVASLRKIMDDEVAKISRLGRALKTQIQQLQTENEENRKRYPRCGPGSATDRHRTSVTLSLGKRFKDLMTEFMALRDKITADHRTTVERRVYIVTGEKVSDEDVDRIIETGQSESILQAAVSAQGQTAAVKDAILEIQERHSAVSGITKQLLELQQMFMDMATMVESQSEMLESIESHVGAAVETVEKSSELLQQAVTTQQSTRKWQMIAVAIIIVVLLIIIIPSISH